MATCLWESIKGKFVSRLLDGQKSSCGRHIERHGLVYGVRTGRQFVGYSKEPENADDDTLDTKYA